MIRSSLLRSCLRGATPVLIAVPLLALADPAVTATAATVAVAAPGGAGSVALRSQVVSGLASDTRIAGVAATTPMTVDILLAPTAVSPSTGLTPAQLETALYTPGSAMYHRFPTPDEYAAQYATPPADAAAAAAYGTAHGMHLVSVNAMRDAVVLSGTATQVEATFATTLATYRAGSRLLRANTSAPYVPSGIGVTGVIGLDTAHVWKTASTGTVSPAQSDCETQYCIGLTTPQDLWVGYDQPTGNPNAPGTTDFGQGQGLAVIGEGQTAPVISDLAAFETANGLPHIPVTVDQVDGPSGNYTDNSGLEEWDIDTQSSTGMAPDATSMKLYFGTGLTDSSLVNAIDAWTGDNAGPLQANMSIDGCESFPGGNAAGENDQTFQNGFDTALAEAVNTGRTLFNSSGDVGSGCPILPVDTNGAAIQPGVDGYPASSPDVTAVGGTVFYGTAGATATAPITARALEYGWTYSGGGTSMDYPEPAYQTSSGLVGTTTPCTTDPATGKTYVQEKQVPPLHCRAVPDISAQSGDIVSNGYAIINNGAPASGAGTSLASPLSMGMWARIQAASTAKGANGFANTALYAAAAKGTTTLSYDPDGDFFDVGDVTNGKTMVTNNGAYATNRGYDEVTGLGVMDVDHLLRDLDANTVPVDNVLPVPPTGGGTTGGNGGGGSSTPASTAACFPLFTGATGADSFEGNAGGNPQLDIVRGDMHVVSLNSSGVPTVGGAEYLQSILTVQDLTDAPAQAEAGVPTPSSYNQYYMVWTYGGATYFVDATVDTTESTALGSPQVTYGDGTVAMTGGTSQYNPSADTNDIGTFTPGPDGTVVIDVPLANVNGGAIAPGTVLSSPHGVTFVEIGNSAAGGSLQTADTVSPQYDYTYGEVCSTSGLPGSSGAGTSGGPGTTVPEAPLALGLPLVGGYAAWRIARRRRRMATV